jgi:hypothetical protein
VALRGGRIVHDGPSAALTVAQLRELYGSEADELFAPAPGGSGNDPGTPCLSQSVASAA